METINQTKKVVYTGKTYTTGGREHGVSKSSDGNLDIRLSVPGKGEKGTNPEQLFAAGWSACFEGALGVSAQKFKVKLPDDTAIDAEVDLVSSQDGYSLAARLNISLPGIEKSVAQQLVDFAHSVCPYSKAIRGNVPVELKLV
jgi:lipoyl-dependent peroxiredoxin